MSQDSAKKKAESMNGKVCIEWTKGGDSHKETKKIN